MTVLLLALLAASLFPDLCHGIVDMHITPMVNTTSGQLMGVVDHEGLPTQKTFPAIADTLHFVEQWCSSRAS
jgi:hypothetical protein